MKKFFQKTYCHCLFLFFIFPVISSCIVAAPSLPTAPSVQSPNIQQRPQQPLRQPPRGVVPDYYYHQPYSAPQPYGGYQQQYQGPPPQYGYPPASRYYTNPYSFQPAAQYPNYDVDYYYVPPAGYNEQVSDVKHDDPSSQFGSRL